LARYHYDPLDRQVDCTSFKQSAIQRHYCQTRLATEIQGAVQRSIMQYDDQLLAQQQGESGNTTTTLLTTDQQRSVLSALHTKQPDPLAYTPYGHRPLENGLLSLLGFNGERPDPVTGHYHLGNGYRQFNPVLMRFNSPDSWSPFRTGGLNAYAYCVGDPVNMADPTGHTPFWVKYVLRKSGIMDVPSIKFTEQQLFKTQENLLKNIDIMHGAGQTPTASYLALRRLNKTRQRDYARLLNNPEHTIGNTPTFTELEPGKKVPTREYYSYLTLDHQSRTPPSPVPEKSSRLTFSDPQVKEVERIVPTPPDGWQKVADIRTPGRSTLWSRRNHPGKKTR
jgi:RHS repeat-associated protein